MYSVEEIYIYPIKGLPGISVESSCLEKDGLRYDRKFMLVDENLSFISQRSHPILTQIEISFINANILLKHNDHLLDFEVGQKESNDLNCRIWEHQVDCLEVSSLVSEWFSLILNEKVKLVRMKTNLSRIKKYSNRSGSTPVSFADGYPVLLLGTASLDLLNKKLDLPIGSDRFRPNVVVKTDLPHEEDFWKRITFGECQLEIIKPCARCQVVNIDQQSGESFKEPLKTLSTYRKEGNKIFFGANASCIIEGEIKVGDVLK